MTAKLTIRPQASGYTITPPTEVKYAALKGGMGAYRSDFDGGTSLVNVTWLVDGDSYNALLTFFRGSAASGSAAFLIDLILESSDFEEYTAYFVPDSLKLSATDGINYRVDAQLEVFPPSTDPEVDAATITLFEASL